MRLTLITSRIAFALLGLLAFASSVRAATIDWTTVGNPGNVADTNGFGSVATIYQIDKYEVTNAEYAEFLNAKDPGGTNTLSLYNGSMTSDARGGINFAAGNPSGTKYSVKTNMGNKPVVHVSFYDAMRFSNWLNNGQGAGSTETGAYTLLGGGATPSNGLTVTRNVGAQVFVASENEWYKAAYHQPFADANDYWAYATKSNTVPTVATANATGDINNPGANVVNYNNGAIWNGQTGNVTTVGSATAASFYGTFDQTGNVWEWEDSFNSGTSGARVIRDGNWVFDNTISGASFRGNLLPDNEANFLGFRVASLAAETAVPEPSTYALGLIGLAGLGLVAWRRRK